MLGYTDFLGARLRAVELALLGFALYLFYRLVLAVERVARALEE